MTEVQEDSSESFQKQGSVDHCYGCGAKNPDGLQIQSYWEGEEAVCTFSPKPYHCAGSRNIVYGGLIASLIDCHSCNTAIANHFRDEGREIGTEPAIFCVTAQLNVSFKKPADISKPLNLRSRIRSSEGKKTWIDCEVYSDDVLCAVGEILAIRVQGEL